MTTGASGVHLYGAHFSTCLVRAYLRAHSCHTFGGKGVSHLVYAGAHKQSGADEALEAYRAAQELAVQHLATTHPIRLVSYVSVCLYLALYVSKSVCVCVCVCVCMSGNRMPLERHIYIYIYIYVYIYVTRGTGSVGRGAQGQ